MPRRPPPVTSVLVAVAVALAVGTTACSGSWGGPPAEGSSLALPPPTSITPGSPAGRPVPGAVAPVTRPPVVTSAVDGAGGAGEGRVALTFDADLTPAMRQRLRDGRVDSYANMAVIDVLEAT